MTESRVALFQADWPLQSHTENVVRCLVDAGFGVDLFVSRCDSYVDLGALATLPGFELHDLSPLLDASPDGAAEAPPFRSLHRFPVLNRRLARLRAQWKLLRGSRERFVPAALDRASERIGADTRCLIGIEKHGLIWAGRIAARLGIPLVYLNLELYVDDFAREIRKNDPQFRRLREVERQFHARAAATIVQDEDRAARLFFDNGLAMSAARVFHVPCGARGGIRRASSTWIHDRLGLPPGQLAMLYFGQIHEDRYSVALAEVAQNFAPDWTLVLHGWGPRATIEKIRQLDRNGRVALSLELVPPAEILDVVAAATVGFSLYAPTPWNDQLTACASEKLAYYAQCGVPFVGFDYPNYRRVVATKRWGILVESTAEVPAAVGQIVANHREMRGSAFEAFSVYYDFPARFAPVVEWIQSLPRVADLASRRDETARSEIVVRPAPERWSPPPWLRNL